MPLLTPIPLQKEEAARRAKKEAEERQKREEEDQMAKSMLPDSEVCMDLYGYHF